MWLPGWCAGTSLLHIGGLLCFGKKVIGFNQGLQYSGVAMVSKLKGLLGSFRKSPSTFSF
jgi:hypothetical protein